MPLVLSEDEAIALGQHVLGFGTTDQMTVMISHSVGGITRIANNQVLFGDDGESLQISIEVQLGKRAPVRVVTDQRDDVTLRAMVRAAESISRQQTGDTVNPEATYVGPQRYRAVALWSDQSARTMDVVLPAGIPAMLELTRAAKLEGAGFIGGLARTSAVVRQSGLAVACRDTDFECSLTARAIDGSSSGWAGAVARDWSRIDPRRIAERAVAIARRAERPVALEPGRRTAILGPVAVAQMTRAMAGAYSAPEVLSGNSPLSDPSAASKSKIGQRVFDARLRVVSDPADPDGGFLPFYFTTDAAGIARQPIVWVEGGVLKSLAYDIEMAVKKGVKHAPQPSTIRMEAVPGTKTLTLDEMIAECKEGIYVNRFHSLSIKDFKSGLLSGVTRDGCFLVKDGKIAKSLKNFRFADSPFQAFNRIEAVGKAERAPLGYRKVLPYSGLEFRRLSWPMEPVIVPPLMVRDFNFAALSDAV